VVGVGALVYLASWSGWMRSDGGWSRDWAAGRDTAFPFVPDVLRSLWHYHQEMFNFHTHLTTPHTYDSHPWSWLVVARPVSYWFLDVGRGVNGCELEKCSTAVLAIGTPLLWWTALFALGYTLWRWLVRRDWRAGAILAGVAATYLPWFLYSDRTIFYFYAVSCLPFLVLAVTMMIGAMLGGPAADPRRRAWGAAAGGLIVLLVMVNFIWLYPVLSAEPISVDDWRARMWFHSWI
jgi:dolichyl-phosphate-mannose--protein O-mannosyl transferase